MRCTAQPEEGDSYQLVMKLCIKAPVYESTKKKRSRYAGVVKRTIKGGADLEY